MLQWNPTPRAFPLPWMNIVVNCFNSHTSGGLSVARKFLSALEALNNNKFNFNQIYVVCSSKSYSLLAPFYSESIFVFIVPPQLGLGLIDQIYKVAFYLPFFCKKISCSLLVNLGDVPVPLCPSKQIFYFDWAFATISWFYLFKYSGPTFLYKSLKRLLFSCFLFCSKNSTLVVAQTKTQKHLLSKRYNISSDNMLVLPNTSDLSCNSKYSLVANVA